MSHRILCAVALAVAGLLLEPLAGASILFSQRAPGVTAEVVPYGVGADGANAERVLLRVAEEPTGRLVPLLPYVFFDDGDAAVPARYLHSDSASTSDPFVRRYRSILEIVAARMREHPTERLTLVGTSSRAGADRRARDVARRRAEAVADVLATRHGIGRSRFVVRSRGLPAHASNSAHEEGRAENRRVELVGGARLLGPVDVGDTLALVSSPGMRMIATAAAATGIASYRIEMRHDGGLFRRLTGTRAPNPIYFEEFTPAELARFAAKPTGIDVTLTVRDSTGDSMTTPARRVLFDVARSRRPQRASEGRPQDRESIVLFDFDSAELRDDAMTIVGDLLARVPADARLSVTGYTDETGDEERNRALSQARADAVAAAFPGRVAVARGGGESGGHHWNRLPEDRFYSRVARVAVTMP